MVNLQQLLDWVVKPALSHVGLYNPAAAQLVIGTGLQESRYQYLHQVGGGPACGFWQMEPATHKDMWENFIEKRDRFKIPLQQILAPWPDPLTQLATNLNYGAAMCRLFYYRLPHALPKQDDREAQAAYWKQFYNTQKGRGHTAEFLKNAELAYQLRY